MYAYFSQTEFAVAAKRRPSSCGKPLQMARNAADMVKSSCEKCGSGVLSSIPATPSIHATASFRAAVIGIVFLPAVKVNKDNTLSYLWMAPVIAGSLLAGSGCGAVPFPSIPVNMQGFVLVDISIHVCLHFC